MDQAQASKVKTKPDTHPSVTEPLCNATKGGIGEFFGFNVTMWRG